MNKIIFYLLTILLFLVSPIIVNSAEILQINSSSKVLIGDQNRNIPVSLICVKVDDSNELKAKELLKKNFPRGTKVKIKPFGKNDDYLLAKLYNLKNNKEMTELLISKGFSNDNCH